VPGTAGPCGNPFARPTPPCTQPNTDTTDTSQTDSNTIQLPSFPSKVYGGKSIPGAIAGGIAAGLPGAAAGYMYGNSILNALTPNIQPPPQKLPALEVSGMASADNTSQSGPNAAASTDTTTSTPSPYDATGPNTVTADLNAGTYTDSSGNTYSVSPYDTSTVGSFSFLNSNGGDISEAAHGGRIRGMAAGGLGSLPEATYAAGGKLLRGPGDGMSDSIPAVIGGAKPQRAALADGEFVIPADVVSHLGNGSTEAGSRKLYEMMDRIRKARTGKSRQAPQLKTDRYLPA
jgi:hypothetical protein